MFPNSVSGLEEGSQPYRKDRIKHTIITTVNYGTVESRTGADWTKGEEPKR